MHLKMLCAVAAIFVTTLSAHGDSYSVFDLSGTSTCVSLCAGQTSSEGGSFTVDTTTGAVEQFSFAGLSGVADQDGSSLGTVYSSLHGQGNFAFGSSFVGYTGSSFTGSGGNGELFYTFAGTATLTTQVVKGFTLTGTASYLPTVVSCPMGPCPPYVADGTALINLTTGAVDAFTLGEASGVVSQSGSTITRADGSKFYFSTSSLVGYTGSTYGGLDTTSSYDGIAVEDAPPALSAISPEPGSLILSGTGVLAMAGMVRRKLLG